MKKFSSIEQQILQKAMLVTCIFGKKQLQISGPFKIVIEFEMGS